MKTWLIILVLTLGQVFGAEAVLPPMPASPVQEFRQWLTMGPAERQAALASRSEAGRAAILAKLQEYDGLPAAARKARLDAAELHWYLRPLMEMTPAERTVSAQQIPEPWRGMALNRLKQWEGVSPEVQREVLRNEVALKYASAPPPPLPVIGKSAVETERLKKFLMLPMQQVEKAMGNFPAAERAEMGKTLQEFRALTPEQREICVKSFGKFAALSAEEQSAFVRSVERWRAMDPKDREMWRQLVKMMPPMPIVPPIPNGPVVGGP